MTATHRRQALRILCATASAAALMSRPLQAQAQPAKVTRLVVPYAPGGGTDILARQLAEALATELGAPVIVENRPGAGGNIGADFVAKSAPDGSTLLMGDLTLAVNPSLFKRMPFDPASDLQPVAPVASAPLVLVVHPGLKVSSVRELVALAKARPGTLSFATAGNGNPTHIAGELFRIATGIDIVQVPYKGAGPALIDVIGGQVSMLFTGLSSTRTQIEMGKVRALAVTGPKRAAGVPQLPTMAEAGFAQVEVTSWWGLFAPAGLPHDAAAKLAAATAKVLREPRLRGRLSVQAIEPWEGNAAVLGQKLRVETARWREVIAQTKIVPE